jgi:hypothetical protein
LSLTDNLGIKDKAISEKEKEIKVLEAKVGQLQQKVKECIANHSRLEAVQLDPGKKS